MSDFNDLFGSNLFSVAGQVVLISGGGTGIGLATARGFALNGAKVYIVGRRAAVLNRSVEQFKADVAKLSEPQRSSAGTIIAIPGDVSHKDSIAKLHDDFVATGETKIDTLICCAGVNIPQTLHVEEHKVDDVETLREGLWSAEWEGFQKTFDINVSGLYFTCVAFSHLLAAASEGSGTTNPSPSIALISSIGGIHNGRRGAFTCSYQASKAAVIHLNKCLAARFAPFGIRVNTIAPGVFPSEMTFPTSDMLNEKLPDTMKVIPAGRAGTAGDIAGSLMYLSSRAGAYTNGACIVVDGGRVLNVSGI